MAKNKEESITVVELQKRFEEIERQIIESRHTLQILLHDMEQARGTIARIAHHLRIAQ